MAEPQTWRELLYALIENAQERQRIATLSGINPITLLRWVNNEGNPRPRNLHQLLAVLPEHATELTRLIQKEYPMLLDIVSPLEEDLTKIPSRFYNSVMQSYTKTAPSLRFWSISKLILQQLLQHLDPYRQGFLVTVVGCTMPSPAHRKIRSLRILLGQGISPWEGTWDRYPLFMGAESLSGYVVSNRRLVTIQDTTAQDHLYYPMVPVEHAHSIAVAPLLRGEAIAGCLYASSTQLHYFTPERLELFQNYAQLLTVAFTPDEFYSAYAIDLALFPEQKLQERYFSNFQQRLLYTMRQAISKGQRLTSQQATDLVMSELEDELLQLAHQSVELD